MKCVQSKRSSPWLKMYLALFSYVLVCLLWPQNLLNFLLVTDSFWEALRGSERLRHKCVCVTLRCGQTHSYIGVNKYPDMITSNICVYGKWFIVKVTGKKVNNWSGSHQPSEISLYELHTHKYWVKTEYKFAQITLLIFYIYFNN